MARPRPADPPVLENNQRNYRAAIPKDVSGDMDPFTAFYVVSSTVSLSLCVVGLPVSFGSRAA
jgi:hypothetical protein